MTKDELVKEMEGIEWSQEQKIHLLNLIMYMRSAYIQRLIMFSIITSIVGYIVGRV